MKGINTAEKFLGHSVPTESSWSNVTVTVMKSIFVSTLALVSCLAVVQGYDFSDPDFSECGLAGILIEL